MNKHSNDELARLLHNNASGLKSPAPKLVGLAGGRRDPRRPMDVGRQQWTFGNPKGALGSLSEIEVRALFAALSRGTRFHFGREPTVAELLQLKEQVNAAGALVSSANLALQGTNGVHFEEGKAIFGDLTGRPPKQSGAA